MPNHMADANLEVDPIDSDGEKDECFVKTVGEPEHFFDLGDDFFDGRLMKRQTTLFRKAFQITSKPLGEIVKRYLIIIPSKLWLLPRS